MLSAGRSALSPDFAKVSSADVGRRAIPSTGEMIPVIGCGTYRGFDVGDEPRVRTELAGVVTTLLSTENAVIDSSPMYGQAERVTGDLLSGMRRRASAFLATKVWTHGKHAGIAQMEKSFKLLQTDRIDLIQVHNLIDCQIHLPTLDAWKAEGRIRYTGLTHYHRDAYAEMRALMLSGSIDFIQINYSLEDRAAEQWLLPLAFERGIAVLINMPFGGGALINRLSRQSLPSFAESIGCRTWSQLLLKFVLGHPAVTSIIPGTGSATHMAENMVAAHGQFARARDLILGWWLSA